MKVKENCIVPIPVTLNCWKHHAGFIKSQIRTIRNKNISDTRLKEWLLVIGNSQMDVYLGQLSPEEICREILKRLKKLGCYSAKKFKQWINDQAEGYKMIKLSDKSVWTLRLGDLPKRYIHIHPGRYSVNTVRVKALTLKTAIAFLIKSNSNSVIEASPDIVNNIRKNVLGAPPLKSLYRSSRLGKFLVLLKEMKS